MMTPALDAWCRRGLAILAVSGAFAGCMVGPDYARPETALAPRFDNSGARLYTPDPIDSAWWAAFNDPTLTRLVLLAGEANHDLRIADANLRETRELLFQARLDRYPVVPLGAGYARTRLSEAAAPGLDSDARTDNLFFAGFDATWELDVYGRVRRTVEARRADVESLEAVRRDVAVLVSAEVARNYFLVRGGQERLVVLRQNAENQHRTYDLTMSLLQGGRGTELDTSRAQAQLEATLANIPPVQAQVRQAMYRLSVLTGQDPQALVNELEPYAPLPGLPQTVPVGDPESLVRRRPDVVAAERELAAATARIGVQTADLYPRITFEGSFGLEANNAGDLFTGGAGAFSFGPRLRWAAFDLARVRAQVRAADARAEAALARFEITVLEALEETDGTLIQYSSELERREHLENANNASRTAAELARKRYQQGVDDFLTVLDAERRQLEAEDQLADSSTRCATALIAVYKALAGGWEWAPAADPAQAPAEDPAAG